MSQVTIYHNPRCGTSRNTLAMIRESGVEPEVIEYLKTPLTRVALVALVAKIDLPVRSILREKGTPYIELGLDDKSLSEDALVDVVMQYPILMNRPIVVTSKGAKLCRPSEVVFTLLENPSNDTFTKEGGQLVKP